MKSLMSKFILTPRFSSLLLPLLILTLWQFSSFAQTIATTTGTFKLISVSQIVGPEEARSAKQVAAMTKDALFQDVRKLIDQGQDLEQQVKDFNVAESKFTERQNKYSLKNSAFQKDREEYVEKLNIHPTKSDTNNNVISPEKRNATTVKRDETDKVRFSNWQAKLKDQSDELKLEYSNISKDYKDLISSQERIKKEAARLDAKVSLAYNQLDALNKYIPEMNALLKYWKYEPLDTNDISTEIERLKAISNNFGEIK
jgi:chromosome segregation ATPase